MKQLFLLSICILILYVPHITSGNCKPSGIEEKCETTDYEAYVECIRKQRAKRSAGCQNSSPCDSDNCEQTCNECDCNSCSYSTCQGSCNSCCNTCCDNNVQCRTNHCCHKTCHAECKTANCRTSCRNSCYESVNKIIESEKVIVSGGGQGSSSLSSRSNSSNINAHNITTIINLNNVINNTNVIDVPINVTYTNQNNISLTESANNNVGKTSVINTIHPSQIVNGTASKDNCCIMIGPRKCTKTKQAPFVRCFHTRSKQCGSFCSASIVHQEVRQVCQQTVVGPPSNCQQQLIYIPQPKPRCTYQSNWPYVSCSIQKSGASCEGCYKHYVDKESKAHQNCPAQCYDEGFNVSPYYRQGPFYQPTYSAVPPCYYSQMGGCGGGYGGYGGQGYPGGYAYGYGAPSYGMPPMGMPPMPYGVPPAIPGYENWVPDINENGVEEDSTDDSFVMGINGTDTEPFDPVINVGPIIMQPYPYPNYAYPGKEVEIDVAIEPGRNKPDAEVIMKNVTDSSEDVVAE